MRAAGPASNPPRASLAQLEMKPHLCPTENGLMFTEKLQEKKPAPGEQTVPVPPDPLQGCRHRLPHDPSFLSCV